LRLPPPIAPDSTQLPTAAASNLYYCAGQTIEYAAGFTSTGAFRATLTDLASPGRREEFSRGSSDGASVVRSNAQWAFARQELKISANHVVNAATQTAEIAPGSLVSIFGSGLAGPAFPTAVTVSGLEARVQSANEFRLNLEIPNDAPPGAQTLRVESPFGLEEVPITILPVAPAIFQDEVTRRGVIVNAGGAANSPVEPATRGTVITVYATGLGRTTVQGRNQVVVEPVTVVIQGVETPAAFAGRAEGLPGVYVVNVTVPAGLPPGLALPLLLRQSGAESNAVTVAIR
jgi:uncharacterized protein (TIGR03437 family)